MKDSIKGKMAGSYGIRPSWCPHSDCSPIYLAHNAVCGGLLSSPIPHDGDTNTHSLCLRAYRKKKPIELLVNEYDLNIFRTAILAIGMEIKKKKGATLSGEPMPDYSKVIVKPGYI